MERSGTIGFEAAACMNGLLCPLARSRELGRYRVLGLWFRIQGFGKTLNPKP